MNFAAAEDWQSPLLVDHPLVGQIIDLSTGQPVNRQSLFMELDAARFVLIGEKHDNPDHHKLEQILLTELIRDSDHSASVVFEMLDDSQAAAVRKLSAKDSLATMKTRLNWPEHGWDWNVYGPLFKQTLVSGAKLVTGNVNNALLKSIYKADQSVLKEPRFSTMSAIGETEKNIMLEQIYDSHCEMMPRDSLEPMVQIQLAKDASMASALAAARTDKAIMIAGGFHVSRILGVPLHLHQRVPNASLRVLMLMEVDEENRSAQDYYNPESPVADYLWFTPKATDKDYCADLRRQHGKQK